jgi:hypothetical protein
MNNLAQPLEKGHVLYGLFNLFTYGSDDFYKVSFECNNFGDTNNDSPVLIPLGRLRFSDFTWFKPEKIYEGQMIKQLVFLGEENGINYFGTKQLTLLYEEFKKLSPEKQEDIVC